MEKLTQTKEIKEWLERGKTITSMQAFERFGATRLSAIIYQLRRNYGMNIVAESKEVKTRYGRKVIVAEYRYIPENIKKEDIKFEQAVYEKYTATEFADKTIKIVDSEENKVVYEGEKQDETDLDIWLASKVAVFNIFGNWGK
jgi:ABC-type sugar transport system ATPase subunit